MSDIRKRTFYYPWCDKTETDFVCKHCETIVEDVIAGCQWCNRNRAPVPEPGEKKPNPGLVAMQEKNATKPRPEPKAKADRPAGGVNPGILAMREKNRLRREEKLKCQK